MSVAEGEKVGACWECGYSLRGLPTPRCPECGRAFDPNDPATMNMGDDVRGPARWLMKPPGWPLYSLTAVAALISVWAAAAPMPPGQIGEVVLSLQRLMATSRFGVGRLLARYDFLEVRYLYAFIAWGAVAGIWWARRLARGAAVFYVAKRRAAKFAYWRRWLIPHFALAATVLFCMTTGPVYIGFWLSQQNMDARRQRPPGGAPPSPRSVGPVWVGIYPLPSSAMRQFQFGYVGSSARADPARVVISTWGGFIYVPEDERPTGRSARRHMGGGWYRYERGDGSP